MSEARPVEPRYCDEDPEAWAAIATWEANRADTALRALEAAEAKLAEREWISVKEQLPPLNTVFDVWDSIHQYRIADYGPFTGTWDDDFRRDVLLVRGHHYWRLAPEPPKEQI